MSLAKYLSGDDSGISHGLIITTNQKHSSSTLQYRLYGVINTPVSAYVPLYMRACFIRTCYSDFIKNIKNIYSQMILHKIPTLEKKRIVSFSSIQENANIYVSHKLKIRIWVCMHVSVCVCVCVCSYLWCLNLFLNFFLFSDYCCSIITEKICEKLSQNSQFPNLLSPLTLKKTLQF